MDLSKFEEDLVLRGCEIETVESYLNKAKQFLRECKPFNEKTVRAFLVALLKKGRSPSTINIYRKIIRQLGKSYNLSWVENLEYCKIRHKPYKAIFSDEEIEKVINLPCPKRFNPIVWHRWTVWLTVLAFSGMRPSEVSKLTVETVDFGTNNFVLEKTKTDPRRVPIALFLKPLLTEYIKNVDNYLFPVKSKRGHVWRKGWYKHLAKRLEILNIKRSKLSAYSFRHSFITNLWKEDARLPDIMAIVGHKRAETTLLYTHLNNQSAQKAINKHSLIRKNACPKDKLERLIEEARKEGLLDDKDFSWEITDQSITIAFAKKVLN